MKNMKYDSVWNDFLKYLKGNFTKGLNIRRLICMLIAAFIVIVPSMIMYFWTINQSANEPLGTNGFLYISIAFNEGVGFSLFSNSTAFVFLIQIFTSLIILFIIIFNKKWYYVFLLSLAFWGGVFNIIDRMVNVPWQQSIPLPDWTVIDYFRFGFMDFAIFNFPDVFVCIGSFGFVIIYIIMTIIILSKEVKNDKDNTNDK